MRTPVLLAVCLIVTKAQVYKFEKSPVPDGYSLNTLYMFYIYSEKDAPQSSRKPSVEFQYFLTTPDSPSQAPKEYHSVQVALIPFDSFWDLVGRDKFCSSYEEVKTGQAAREGQLFLRKPRPVDVSILSIPFAGSSTPKVFTQDINKTGAYVLTFVNCANFTKASVTGSVVVKHAYGMLPANEYYTMIFYGWLTVLYSVVSIAWLAGLISQRRYLIFFQKGIAAISFCGMLEAISVYGQYKFVNSTGIRSEPLFVLSIICYTYKYTLFLRLVLNVSMCEGMITPELGWKMSAKVIFVNMMFMSQQCMWKLIMSFRYCSLLDNKFLLLASIPGLFIYAFTFAWVFVCFSKLMDALSRQDSATVIAFKGTQRLLTAGFCISIIVAAGQLFELTNTNTPWKLQWVPADGAAHSIFLMSVVGMMFVWWPSEAICKYAYQPQVNEDEGDRTGVSQADELEPLPPAHVRDLKMKSAGVPPECIGITDKEENKV